MSAQLETVHLDQLMAASQQDPVLSSLRRQVPRRWPTRRRNCPDELQAFHHCREELTLVRNLVVRRQRVFVPTVLRPRMVALAHEGHQGVMRSKQRARELLWWPNSWYYKVLWWPNRKWVEVGFCADPTTDAAIQFLETIASREGYPCWCPIMGRTSLLSPSESICGASAGGTSLSHPITRPGRVR